MKNMIATNPFDHSTHSQEGTLNMTTITEHVANSARRSRRIVLASLLAILVAIVSTPQESQAIIFDNSDLDELWSNDNNWDTNSSPAGLDVVFNDTASVASTVTNIVDASISVGSFTMTNVAGDSTGNFHTTQINSGQTLTITGDYTQGVTPCAAVNACTDDDTTMTFTGPGTLTYDNSSGNFLVGIFSGSYNRGSRDVTLDMAGLSTFNMDADLWELGRVGAGTPTLMTLADTNNITANTLDMSQWNDSTTLELGRVNNLNIDTIRVAEAINTNATIKFDTGLTSPSVVIRDSSGSGGALLNMEFEGNQAGVATVDFTGGSVDGLFTTIDMAHAAPNNNTTGNAQAILTFDEGTITATTILMGLTTVKNNATATLNVNGTGTLNATTIEMADLNSGSEGDVTARLNLGGGTVRASIIQAGDTLGTGTPTREINFSSGTLRNASGTDLSVGTAIDINILTAAAHTFEVDSGQTMTISGVIDGTTGTIEKTGDGTLILNGDSTYTGTTNVNAGTLGGTGSLDGDVNVNNGGALGPGTSPGTFSVEGDVTFNTGGVFDVELAGLNPGEFDVLDVTGGLTFDGGTINVTYLDPFGFNDGDSFVIATATDGITVNGNLEDLISGNFVLSLINGGNDLLLTAQIPEPSSLLLLGLGALGLLRQTRRRRARVSTQCQQ